MKPRKKKNILVKNQARCNSQREVRLLHSRTTGPTHIIAEGVFPAGTHTPPPLVTVINTDKQSTLTDTAARVSACHPSPSNCWHHRHTALFGLPHLPLSVFLCRYGQRSFSYMAPQITARRQTRCNILLYNLSYR